MPVDEEPRRATGSGYQRLSLVRCRVCRRTDDLSSNEIMLRMQEGGAVCCGQVMDLFVPTTWPGMSGVTRLPQPRVIAG